MMDLIEKMKGLLLNPIETFKQLKDEELSTGLRYFIIFLLLFAALTALIAGVIGNAVLSMLPQTEEYRIIQSFIQSGGGFIIAGLSFIFTIIMYIIMLFLGGLLIHLGILLVGGKQGYDQTVKSLIYGGTPLYLFGWIPGISIIGFIWALILVIFGIKEFQDISMGKAVIAVLLPIIIIGAIFAFIIFSLILSGLSTMPLPQ